MTRLTLCHKFVVSINQKKEIMNISLNELADIERELAKCVCNYQTLLLEWADARKNNNVNRIKQVDKELQETNSRMTELRKQQEEW